MSQPSKQFHRAAFLAGAAFCLVAWSRADAHTIRELNWLQGCWSSTNPGERQTTEHWMKPTRDSMLGLSQTVTGDKMLEFEFMRIAQEADGEIYFIAKPSGQPEARFKLITVGANEIVFENPAHDFPQRIIYRREGDSLNGRIEGTVNGQEKASDFPMKRVSCDE